MNTRVTYIKLILENLFVINSARKKRVSRVKSTHGKEKVYCGKFVLALFFS